MPVTTGTAIFFLLALVLCAVVGGFAYANYKSRGFVQINSSDLEMAADVTTFVLGASRFFWG